MTGTPTDARPGVPEPLEDEASYGTRVEEAFIGERGTPFFLAAEGLAAHQRLARGGHSRPTP